MGEYDSRRSSRVRTSNQSQSQQSSTASSSASGRAERASRSSTQRTSSSQLTTPTASTPSETADDTITLGGETTARTLRSRVKDEDRDRDHAAVVLGEELSDMSDNDIQEDDESVRCICGFDEYPGPPPKEDTKHGSKDTIDLDPFAAASVSDEVAGFFLQCDICKVWQHGGCVGILNAASSPEEYFCEQCRKDFHKISVASSGQRYSHYLPLSRNSRSASRQTSAVAKETAKSPKQQKEIKPVTPAHNTQTAKRRSTMNSRVVYDEEEELRRAIEASKEDAPKEALEVTTKRAKRGRSDSNEKLESSKRQRTGSRSPSPEDDTAIQDDSDDIPMRNGLSKNRAAAIRNQREKAEKEERDRQRSEASNKRKGRADRRRADDSDPSEEMPLAQRAAARALAAATGVIPPPPKIVSPPQPPPTKPEKSTAKSKKSTSRKKGRNQYTKDRDRSPTATREKPERTRTRRNRGANARNQPTKPRELTWDDMNRWVAFCMDFTQKVEQEFYVERPEGISLDRDKDTILPNMKKYSKDKDIKGKGKGKEKEISSGGSGSGSGSGHAKKIISPFLAPPHISSTVPLNGGSPLKNCIEGPSDDDPPAPPPPPPRPSSSTASAAVVTFALPPPPNPPPPAQSSSSSSGAAAAATGSGSGSGPSSGSAASAPAATATAEAANNKPTEKKVDDEMNLSERLDFIKNQIKFWYATFGPDAQGSLAAPQPSK